MSCPHGEHSSEVCETCIKDDELFELRLEVDRLLTLMFYEAKGKP